MFPYTFWLSYYLKAIYKHAWINAVTDLGLNQLIQTQISDSIIPTATLNNSNLMLQW